MDFISDISLVDGPVLWLAIAAGVSGSAYLLWRRRRMWLVVILAAAAAAVGIIWLVHWLLIYVFSTFPEELPREVLAWSVPPVAALLLAILRLPRSSWRGRVASIAAAAGVVLLSAVQINAYFGLNHTVADVTGTAVARIGPLEDSLKRHGPGTSVTVRQWQATGDMPSNGTLRKATIPGTESGFAARDAFVYLPPAYLANNRPKLPVLVLFAGQPGAPADWLTGGALRSQMDRFAARHGGVAPVVVVVDPNGTPNGNTLCMDSKIARADTYLSRDVPSWIRGTLDVDQDPKQWAVGGFSFGGTCAMQMGTRHPDVYPSILAFSSEKEPALAKERRKTIEASFGEDTAAFESQTPLGVMEKQKFSGKAAYFAVGSRDPEFIAYMNLLADSARKAGFDVEARQVPNAGHSWETPAKGMQAALDFLAARWGVQG
ncbi:alpha/beta hydrolase family protein [Arthrobacter sp. M4]|uniref:alpha/beta hydrolase n=1 Tax=Arthrobacter sp. M4 TaxID=218160 RepID=UPI001CDB62AC|nr:alpha/beta hydrolase-fold protein [Arthrobacter sp. M4]MCA4132170.1 esterase family protein [Arthrobacter sp. M4]